MNQYFATLLTAFLASTVIFPVLIKTLIFKQLVDMPGGRKIHTSRTPHLGGFAISTGVGLSLLIWTSANEFLELRYVFIGLMIMFLFGLKDDMKPMHSIQKLFGQFVAGALLFWSFNLRLDSFYDIVSFPSFPLWISFLVTVFTVIVITNAYNLLDGIDGLAGSIGLIILLFYGSWFALVGHFLGIICFAFVGAIVAFLRFNWTPARIFMGDSGSMLIGFFIAICTVNFINLNHNLADSSLYKFQSSVGSALLILLILLFDTARIFTLRILSGRSPFTPDNKHLHHILLKSVSSHSKVSLILMVINLMLIGMALLLMNSGGAAVLSVVAMCAAVGLFSVTLFHKKSSAPGHKPYSPQSRPVLLKKTA